MMPLTKAHISLIAIIVGKKIRELRERDNVSQEKLSEHLDISRPTLVGYETGKQCISVAEAYLAADYFKIDISELVPDIETIKKHTSIDNALAEKEMKGKSLEEVKTFIDRIRKD